MKKEMSKAETEFRDCGTRNMGHAYDRFGSTVSRHKDIRDEMRNIRYERALKLSDKQLAHMIVSYYEQNQPGVGEKVLHDLAKEWVNKDSSDIPTDLHDNVALMFSSVCLDASRVPDLSIDHTIVAQGEENILHGIIQTTVPLSARRIVQDPDNPYTHIVPVIVKDGAISLGDDQLGHLEDKFLHKHRDTQDMEGFLVMVDHSKGKLKNMTSCVMFDLAQKFDGGPLHLMLEKANEETAAKVDGKPVEEPKPILDEAFIKAIDELSKIPEESAGLQI